ncbi:MAG: metallophosphoesterase [Chitinophagales bacterium]|nr:metallophosphoesterase [Chitinophagales bacterium]
MKNNLTPYLVLTLFILVIDYYSFQAVRTVTRDWSSSTRKVIDIIFWSITAITFLALFSTMVSNPFKWPVALRSYLFATVFLIYLSKLFLVVFLILDDLIRLFRWIFSQFNTSSSVGTEGERISRLKFLNMIGVGIASFTFFAGVYGMAFNAYNYKIRRIRVKLPNLPASFHGLKIVQLSDIHSGSLMQTEPIVKAVERINKEQPDLIFFTGDLVNNHASEVEPFIEIFAKLQAKEGKYSTFGNHDYADYDASLAKEERLASREKLKEHHKSMGWDLLWDENRIVKRDDDSLAIIGVQNIHIPRRGGRASFRTYGNLEKAYQGSEQAPVKLLLSHDPTHWDGEVNQRFKDIDITFSGHTHGAQAGIEIPGFRWSPAQYIYKQWAGLYKTGSQYLYVNRGFGFLGYPGRVGILPEITVMILEKA